MYFSFLVLSDLRKWLAPAHFRKAGATTHSRDRCHTFEKNMIQKLLLFIALLFGVAVNAQNLTDKEIQVENVDIVTREINENDLIPFAVIENPPLAPGCKKKECTSKYIQMYVARKFNTELANEIGISGKIQIMIEFIIDVEGNPINISATGGPEIMNQHAIDVIAVLPKLKPGMKDGKPINVSYKLPLLFYVDD